MQDNKKKQIYSSSKIRSVCFAVIFPRFLFDRNSDELILKRNIYSVIFKTVA